MSDVATISLLAISADYVYVENKKRRPARHSKALCRRSFQYFDLPNVEASKSLKKEVQRQQEEDELAATTVEERKRMIEYERENIENKPFVDILEETKNFRQNMFKRRYKARVLENQCRKLSVL
ncbi:protein RKD5-like [Lycium barbarum]|uniref:protein RKD5-like n=1 Tax=Lycium barbarum TaxID=112863 RepID=UPI00293F666A|nr:protein RKD5-like [Lycium barbarum]